MRMATSRRFQFLLVALVLAAAGCGSDSAETDPCEFVACSAGGTCQVEDGKGSCICNEGYAGADCSDCAEGYHPGTGGDCLADETCQDSDPCGNHGNCQDDGGQITCLCDTGYAGDYCNSCADGFVLDNQGLCVPEESCPDPDPCPENSHCDDSSGSFECVCDPGYHSDGAGGCTADESCQDPDPCPEHSTCDDSSGSIECVCDPGYQGDNCQSCAPGYHSDGAGGCLPDETCPDPDPCGDHGTCDASSGSPVCICDSGWTGSSCDRCADGYHDEGGQCLEDTDCYDYTFWELSYMSTLLVNDPGDGSPCCYDYNGDGAVDNALGTLFATLAGLGIEVNVMIQDGIVDGSICNLLEYHGMESSQDDGGFDLPFFHCLDEDGDYQDNLSGQESFLVTEDSFEFEQDVCTSIPLNRFRDATVTAGHLEASADIFSGISLPPGPVELLYPHDLHQARLEADLTETLDGIQVQNGKIGGVVPLSNVFENLNQYVAESCACLGLDGDLISWEITVDGFDIQCADTSGSTCEMDTACANLASYCEMGIMLFTQVADIDLDNDGINEGCSVGFEFEAVSAASGGLTP